MATVTAQIRLRNNSKATSTIRIIQQGDRKIWQRLQSSGPLDIGGDYGTWKYVLNGNNLWFWNGSEELCMCFQRVPPDFFDVFCQKSYSDDGFLLVNNVVTQDIIWEINEPCA